MKVFQILSIAVLLFLTINVAHASSQEQLETIFNKAMENSKIYEFYGYHPGMTYGEIKGVASENGRNVGETHAIFGYNVGDLVVQVDAPSTPGNKAPHRVKKIILSRTYQPNTFDIIAKEAEYIAKYGQPNRVTRKSESTLLLYFTPGPDFSSVAKKCVKIFEQKHGAEAARTEKYKINKIGKHTGTDMERKLAEFSSSCPEVVQEYESHLLKKLGATIEISLEPNHNREGIVMYYDAAKIMDDYYYRKNYQ